MTERPYDDYDEDQRYGSLAWHAQQQKKLKLEDPDFTTGSSEVEKVRKEESARVDVAKRFTYHPPKGDQAHKYNYLRQQAYVFALDILRNCPDSRERSLALTKLEEAVMWANASIARNE